MRSSIPLLLPALLIGVLAGCGILGNKDETGKLMNYAPSSMGCLNELGPQFKKFFDGSIQADQWQGTWNCAIDSLKMFKRFVKGSSPEGYTPEDMRIFLSRFLLTSMPVSPALMESSFALKASLFGGKADLLTPAELDRFLGMLAIGRDESLLLLPHFKAIRRSPSDDELLRFSQALQHLGAAIGDGLGSSPRPALSWASAQQLVNEVSKVMSFDASPDMVLWLSPAKRLLFGGSTEGIEGSGWNALFKVGSGYAAPALAAMLRAPESRTDDGSGIAFYLSLAESIRAAIRKTFELHGDGPIPLSEFDRLIDSVPQSWISFDRSILKKTLRPLAGTLLRSKTPDALDLSSVELVYSTVKLATDQQKLIDGFFRREGLDPEGIPPVEFIERAKKYNDPGIDRLVSIVHDYKPMKLSPTGQIQFVHWNRHSRNYLSRLSAIQAIVELLLGSYSSAPDGMSGTQDDLRRFVEDYQDIGFAIKAMEVIPGTYLKRFREMNLFLPASDGDRLVSKQETTEFFSFVMSNSVLSDRIRREIGARCPSQGTDPLDWSWMEVNCFRHEFFDVSRRYYWDHFPELLAYYDSLSEGDQRDFQRAMEIGARRFGQSDKPVASYDVQGFVGLMHYLESMMQRFDVNGDQIMDLDEVLGALPVFRTTLADLGNLDPKDTDMLEAVLTYTINFKGPPKTDILHAVHFLIWKVSRPFWSIEADRNSLYQVIAKIVAAEGPPHSQLSR